MSFYVSWHRRLGHTSQEMTKKLMKDGIIPSLHDNLESYVECVKER